MKMREQLDQLRVLNYQNSTAMKCLVLGRVEWSGPRMVAINGGGPQMIRVGTTKSSDPMVIVHFVDQNDALALTPENIAQWPWPAVEAFPGLDAWLLHQGGWPVAKAAAPRPAYALVLAHARVVVKDCYDSRQGYDRQTAMHDLLNYFVGLTNSDEDEEFVRDAVCEAEGEFNAKHGVEL